MKVSMLGKVEFLVRVGDPKEDQHKHLELQMRSED